MLVYIVDILLIKCEWSSKKGSNGKIITFKINAFFNSW